MGTKKKTHWCSSKFHGGKVQKPTKNNIWIKRRKRRSVKHKYDKCEVYWNEARQDKPGTLKKHVEIVVSIGWFQTFTWKFIVSPIIRTFQHTPGTYPRPPTNSFWSNSFHLGLWVFPGICSRGMLGFSLESFKTDCLGFQEHHTGVSKNKGTPKWMVYTGKPY